MAPRQKPIKGSYRGVLSCFPHRGNDPRLESTKGSTFDSHEVLDPQVFDSIHGDNVFPPEKLKGRRGYMKSTTPQSVQPLPSKTNLLRIYEPMMEEIGIWVMDSDGVWIRDYDAEDLFAPIIHATHPNPPRIPIAEEEAIAREYGCLIEEEDQKTNEDE